MQKLVIDTCALVHANNSESGYMDSSIEMIEKIMYNDCVIIYTDLTLDLNETCNTSHLGQEYLEHLIPGMLGYTFLEYMYQNQRIDYVPLKVPQAIKHKFEQLISNKGDIKVLKITFNTPDKILISNDYSDFNPLKRKLLQKKVDITILSSNECCGFL